MEIDLSKDFEERIKSLTKGGIWIYNAASNPDKDSNLLRYGDIENITLERLYNSQKAVNIGGGYTIDTESMW